EVRRDEVVAGDLVVSQVGGQFREGSDVCYAVRRSGTQWIGHVVEVNERIVLGGIATDVAQRARGASNILLVCLPGDIGVLEQSHQMHRGALVSRRRGVIGRYAEIGPGFQPQVIGQARVDTGRIEVLRGVRAYGEQGVIYVGRGRTARDIRPIVVLHHDEENRLEWLVPGGRHGEAGGGAGHAAYGVADDDRELVAVVGSGGGGCGVAGGGGCADRRAVLLPLIAQGCRARGRDREGRRLTGAHRLTRRLGRDRGSEQRGTHRESGGPAGHAARGVADDDRELVAVVGSGGGGCGVAGGGGCADHRAVLLPLIAQGCRARGRDREGRPLTGAHRLTRRLCRDRGRDRRGRDCGSGGVAGHAAHGVADDDRELVAVVGSGGGGCGVAVGGGCADRRAVLLPLIAQGCRARGGYREGRPLTGAHRLTT